MKKILFYSAYSLCLIQTIFWLFFPFMGPITVINTIKNGLFGSSITTEILHHNIKFGSWSLIFNFINIIITVLYFISIFICTILPVFYKINTILKYKLGIILFLMSMSMLILGKIFTLLFY